jgi:hypothetical protein
MAAPIPIDFTYDSDTIVVATADYKESDDDLELLAKVVDVESESKIEQLRVNSKVAQGPILTRKLLKLRNRQPVAYYKPRVVTSDSDDSKSDLPDFRERLDILPISAESSPKVSENEFAKPIGNNL